MPASQNELVRDHINSKWDGEYDFSKSQNRRESVDEFLKAHPDLRQSSATSAHQRQLEIIAKERGKNISEFKSTAKGKKPNYDPSMNATVTPNAQQVAPSSLEKSAIGVTAVPATIQSLQSYDVDTVGAVFDGLYTGLRLAVPHAKELSPSQKKSLGEVWKEPFNKYLGEHEKFGIVIALSATVGILGANLIEGYKKGKEIDAQKKKTHTLQSTTPNNAPPPKTTAAATQKNLEIPKGDGLTDE